MSFKLILLVCTALDRHLARLAASHRIPPQYFFPSFLLQHHAIHFSRQWDDISLAWRNDHLTHESYNFSFCSPESVVISPLSNISVCQNVTKYRPKSVSTGIFRVIDISCNKTTLYQRYRNCLPRVWYLRCHYLASYSVNRADYFLKICTFPKPFYGTRRFTTASHWKASS
jgi:hypothetical protein